MVPVTLHYLCENVRRVEHIEVERDLKHLAEDKSE